MDCDKTLPLDWIWSKNAFYHASFTKRQGACVNNQIWHSRKTGGSGLPNHNVHFYTYKMVNISKWTPSLHISQVGHTCMFFRLCTCFLDNLVEFHSRNKEVLEMTIRWTTQTKDVKYPWWSPRRDDQNEYMEHMIWSSNEEVIIVWRCSQLQNHRFWFGKLEGSVFTIQNRIWVEIFIVFD
jgi:hypothetical protein